MRSKLFVFLSLLILASMVLAACAPTATPETIVETVVIEKEGETIVVTATPGPVAAETPTLRVNLGSWPDIIDPQKSSFVNEIAHLKMMYEGLTTLDAELNTVPGAAESWEYNPEATELTFTLREGLKYSDGTLLNAKRFEYSIFRNVDPATAGEYASITDDIAGAKEWRYADDTTLPELREGLQVKALDMAGNACTDYEQVDCRVLKIGLAQAAPYFHTVMSLWVTFPAKEELIAEGGDIWWTSSKFHVGNGPFVVKNLEPVVRGYFEPNPNYWGGVATYNLEFRYITDSAVSFEAYKNDEFDIVPLAAEDLATVQNDAVLSQEAQIYAGSCTFAIMFHQLKEPFTNQKVREAFAMALDRETWVSDVLNGLGSPTLTWIPPGFPGYDAEENRWGYDPEAAKAALAESGYTVDAAGQLLDPTGAVVEMMQTFSDTPRNRVRYEWLVAKYKEVLGVDIKLNPVESTTYTALTKDINTAPQMFILGWCADYPDPQNWLSVYWKTGAFGERIGYSNPDLDAKLAEADSTVDPEARMPLYAEAQRMLTDGAPVAFMWNNVNSYLVKPWVKGVVYTPQDSGWPGDVAPLSISIDTSMMP
ncbi:MAG: peptide ABC transporter substrate-binding protein [Bellilinea sp.]